MDVSPRIVSSYTYPRFVSIRTYYLLLPSPLPGTEIQFLAKSFLPTCGVQSSKGNVEFLLLFHLFNSFSHRREEQYRHQQRDYPNSVMDEIFRYTSFSLLHPQLRSTKLYKRTNTGFFVLRILLLLFLQVLVSL